MTNQATNSAEESETIEKTAPEQSESTTPTASTTASNDVNEGSQATTAAPKSPFESPATEAAAPADAPAADAERTEPAQVKSASPAEPLPARSEEAPAIEPAQAEPAAPADETSTPPDIDFGAILEQFEQEQTIFHPGELVNGTVIGVNERGALVDFGYKSEGFVPIEELTGPEGEMLVAAGDKIDVVLRSMHSPDGAPVLSRVDALGRKVWDDIEAAFQTETPVIGKVIDKTKGGLRVDVNGIEAFLPGSQIDSRPIRSLDTYIGEEIEAKVIKFSRRRNNIVLSRKVLTDEVVNAQKAETMSKIEVGYIVDGTIKNLTEYGAFVDIGGIDGLLHVTDMSWGRVHHPGDQFKVGEHIQVKVLKLDREKEKISLGYKQLQPDPWSTVVEVYPVDTKLKGTVSSVTDYGVFVELESGVEGLVHVSEISWSRRAQSPKRIFNRGQEVEVQVLGVDTVEKRISLGMKQFQENPWDRIDQKYPVGARVQGKVRNITDFGAFVELEEGIDGLVHVSDISWAKKIKHPKDVLKKDQEVEAIVTNIDKRGQRLSLSMKDLTPSAWEGFVATHRPGDVVRGTVSRFTNFGIFVELGEGLEGLCHISELSDERVERPEDVAQVGQEMDFKILRIEPQDQKIGLSRRAVGKDDEPSVDTRVYSSEAKSGMASLGELANLRFGNAADEASTEPAEKKKSKKETRAEKQEAAQEAAASEPETPEPAPAADDSPAPPVEAEATIPEPAAAEEQKPEADAEPAEVTDEVAPESGQATGAGAPVDEALADTAANESSTPESPASNGPASETASDETAPVPSEETPEDSGGDGPAADGSSEESETQSA